MALKKIGILWILFGVTTLFWSTFSFGREDLIPGSRYTGARGAGMADAYLPFGEDVASGLFYNPALLGRIRKAVAEPVNLILGTSQDTLSMLNSDIYRVTSLSGYSNTLQNHPGRVAGAHGAFVPTFGLPGFAIGLLMDSQTSAQYSTDGSIQYRSRYQFIPTIGTGFKLFSGLVRVGYSLQWVNQASGSGSALVTDDLSYTNRLQKGSTLSHNFGLAMTVPVRYLPTFNFVVRNAFGSSYRNFSFLPVSVNSSGVPSTEPMTLDGSFSLQPKLGQGATLNLGLVYRDMTNRSGVLLMGHFALGAEFVFRDQFFIRGGWGGGYPAAGVGLKNRRAEMSFAWFSEEVGSQYLGQRDRRVMFQYQIRTF
jgi:hypothetical protein